MRPALYQLSYRSLQLQRYSDIMIESSPVVANDCNRTVDLDGPERGVAVNYESGLDGVLMGHL